MKLRLLSTLLLFTLVISLAITQNLYAAWLVLFIGGAALAPTALRPRLCTVTLTPTEILAATIKAFRTRTPGIDLFGGDFGGMNLLYNHQAIAHIETLGSASTYSAGSGGYKNGAVDGRTLLLDVPITIDTWKTYPVKLTHVNLITDQKNPYGGVIGNGGYVLGKTVVDALLAKAAFSHFSRSSTIANADFDVDGLITITEQMNAVTEAEERYLIVNSAVASILAADARMANAQWFGTPQGGAPFRRWTNAWGFREILEYPSLSANNGTAITGITGVAATDVITATAHGCIVGDRVYVSGLTGGSGLSTGYYYVITAPTANTLTISATIGGSAVNFTTDITDGTLQKKTNLNAVAFERRAFAVKAGAPAPTTAQMAAQFGIPMSTVVDAMYDAETRVAMGMARWQEEGTADLYICPTVLFGTRAGRETTDTAGTSCDYAGHLCITA